MIPMPRHPLHPRLLRSLLAASLLLGVAGRSPLPAADEVPVPVVADRSEHDFVTGTHHLMGHVDIHVPGLVRLQCDDFQGVIPADSTDATNAVMTARGNVRLQLSSKPKGTNAPVQIVATADQAVYTGTNELFVLTGHPRVVSAYGTLTGTTIRYDVATSRASAEDYRFTPDPRMLTNLLERARIKAPGTRPDPK